MLAVGGEAIDRVEDDSVNPGAAAGGVSLAVPGAAEDVIAVVAGEGIAAAGAVELVGARPTREKVVRGPAGEPVVAGAANELHRVAGGCVGPDVEEVVAGTTVGPLCDQAGRAGLITAQRLS